jgi:hypothetical protein
MVYVYVIWQGAMSLLVDATSPMPLCLRGKLLWRALIIFILAIYNHAVSP